MNTKERIEKLEKDVAELKKISTQPIKITFCGDFNYHNFLKKSQEFGLVVQ